MSDIEYAIEAVENRFRKGSKRYEAARYIVRQGREITTDERKALVNEIPIKYKTLQGLFTELRKMGLYPPQMTSAISKPTPTPQTDNSDIIHHEAQDSTDPITTYATKEDFETLKNSINYLASVINGENIEPVDTYASTAPLEEEPEEIMTPEPEELNIQDPSLTRHSIWLKPKTQMYFDMARQGIFANYVGTRDLGPFTQFNGNLSDFFNLIVNDYFTRNFNADIGLLMRRYA